MKSKPLLSAPSIAATIFLAGSSIAIAVGACGSGTTTGGDGGLDGSSSGTNGASGTSGTSGGTSGTSGDASSDAPFDGASSGADGSSLDGCTRAANLDTECAKAYGTAAANGYTCNDVLLHVPPCQPLTALGCTEVCSNRCCP